MRVRGRGPYRHDLPPLANNAEFWTHIDSGAVHAAPSLLDQAGDDENPCLMCYPLQLFPRAITPSVGSFLPITRPKHCVPRQLSVHPGLPSTCSIADCVAQVDGTLEVTKVFLAALFRARTNQAAEVGATGVPSNVRLRKQEYVNALGCGLLCQVLELGQRLSCGSLGSGGGRTKPDSVGCHGGWSASF